MTWLASLHWWTLLLIAFSVVLSGVATAMLVLVVHANVLQPIMEDAAGGTGPQAAPGGQGMGGLGWLILRRMSAANRRLMWPRYEARVRRQLIQAGLNQRIIPEDILSMQELLGLAGLVLGVLVCAKFGVSVFWALLLALGSGFYPLLWVRDQVKKRHHLITRALPYSIDLLTLAVEAGLDFTGALAKVVEKGRPGPLRDELQIVLKQLKMGKTREEALRGLVERVDMSALTSFITTLIQADRMGTSLGKVLRAQSAQMRVERSQRAEKLAAEAPVKMLFPLIACIFPTVFMIIFGPIAFSLLYGGALG